MPVLDHEKCHFRLCSMHTGQVKQTRAADRNAQIREDWDSGEWSLEELCSFWGLSLLQVVKIIRGAADSARPAPRQVRRSS